MASIRTDLEQPEPLPRPERDAHTNEEQTVRRLAYTPAEAALALNVSEAFIGVLYRSGRIPVVFIGRLPRIPIDAFEEWWRSQYGEDGSR